METDIMYLENVTLDYSGFKALNNVNFFVKINELRFLIGPNGAGKTSLLDVICGKSRPTSGRVFFRDKLNLLKLKPDQINRAGISRKFQAPSIFSNLTVHENMELSLTKNRGIFESILHKLDSEDEDKINTILCKVNLEQKKSWQAGSLAHGEKQWLELAMAFVQDPQLLLVDEPVAGMTGNERDKTGDILTEIAKTRSVIVVEHDMNFVEKFSSVVTVLHEGRIISEGSFEKIRQDPYVIDVYLGRDGGKTDAGN